MTDIPLFFIIDKSNEETPYYSGGHSDASSRSAVSFLFIHSALKLLQDTNVPI